MGLCQMIEYWNILEKVSAIGPSVCTLVDLTWTTTLWELQSSINSFLYLDKLYSEKRLEAACARALFYTYDSIETVKSILVQNLDLLPLDCDTDIFGQKVSV